MLLRIAAGAAVLSGVLVLVPPSFGQTPSNNQIQGPTASVAPANSASSYTVVTGTRIALGLINSVSTKHSIAGDRIYLETVFPIVIENHIVIPPGSYVTGTVTEVKRPGRVKGRGELYVRFDSITLPNGVTREFRSRLGSIDARGDERLDKKEGMIQGDSNKGGDARIVGETAATGASIGAVAGAAAGHAGLGAGVGGAAGAAAGLAGVLLTRGPEAILAKGSTIEMVLDRPLVFDAAEVNFNTMGAGRYSDSEGPGPASKSSSSPGGARRFAF
jgi:type IV secretion system protein VirB10